MSDAKYVTMNLVDPIKVGGKTWENFHAGAIRTLLGNGNAWEKKFDLVQKRTQMDAVIGELVRAGVLEGRNMGDPTHVVWREYRLVEGLKIG